MIGQQARDIIRGNLVTDVLSDEIADPLPEIAQWEDHLAEQINNDLTLEDSERTALVQARRGQGQFKKNVRCIETKCRITKVDRLEHLVASHCKPWRDCKTYDERLDGENGLLLTPSIDHLFDRGLISFEDSGTLLLSPRAHRESLGLMGVPVQRITNVGSFTDGQKKYLDYHRESVFLQANL